MVRLGRVGYWHGSWLEAWACEKMECCGYALKGSDGSVTQHPQQTLVDGEACALIRGVMAFKKLL
jgi:hypothetical protein